MAKAATQTGFANFIVFSCVCDGTQNGILNVDGCASQAANGPGALTWPSKGLVIL
jgi:hypothetical protein